jgi:hypothetical protein
MATQYAEALMKLLEQIEKFRRRDLDLEDLKSAIWEAARNVSSHDERELREALQRAEGSLDMTQFTVNEPDVRAEALKVVNTLEARVRAALEAPRI